MKLINSAFTKLIMAVSLSAAFLSLSVRNAIADSPAINITEYELTSKTVEDCVNTAEIVMKEEGFEELNISKTDVFGATEDISVEMYCASDGKTLILVIAGSNPEELQELQSNLDQRISQ